MRGPSSTIEERGGFATREVETGFEALEAVRAGDVALVLLEVALEDMTGYEVCREIRHELGDQLPIFLRPGIRTEPLDRVAGLLLGADDFIVKPYDPAELLARVRRFISRASVSSQVAASREGPRLTRRKTEVLDLLVASRGRGS